MLTSHSPTYSTPYYQRSTLRRTDQEGSRPYRLVGELIQTPFEDQDEQSTLPQLYRMLDLSKAARSMRLPEALLQQVHHCWL